MAPATVPSRNGVKTDEIANTAPAACRPRNDVATGRNANAAPRRTIPRATRQSGTNSVVMIAAKAGGKAVHRIDEVEDEPRVVRLPDRADGIGDERPRPEPGLRRVRQRGPRTRTEVGATEHGVGGDCPPAGRSPSPGPPSSAVLVGAPGRTVRDVVVGVHAVERAAPVGTSRPGSPSGASARTGRPGSAMPSTE